MAFTCAKIRINIVQSYILYVKIEVFHTLKHTSSEG